MAVKKAVKPPAKAAAKKAVAKKAVARKKTARGDTYVCGVCGLAVVIDETCGCIDFCDIICCEKQMKPKVAKAKTKAKK